MGLELIALKNLDDGTPLDEWMDLHPGVDPYCVDDHIFLAEDDFDEEAYFPGYMGRLERGLIYGSVDPIDYECDFPMGAYSSYNSFRYVLGGFNDSVNSTAFNKLIVFSDCKGIIGASLAAELNDDFTRLRNEFHDYLVGEFSYEADDEYDAYDGADEVERYMGFWDDWITATGIARENGAIQFA